MNALNLTRRVFTAPGWRLSVGLLLAVASTPRASADYAITSFDAPGATQGTFALGMNDAGQIVGYYRDAANVNQGFLRDAAGNITTLNFPGAGATEATGISNSGVIVGYYSASNGAPTIGFMLSGGTYTTIDVPGSTQTTIEGISPSGNYIVGTYADSTGEHGFLLSNGVYQSFNVPGSSYTWAGGVNDLGQVVGYYDGISSSAPGTGFLLSNGVYTNLYYGSIPTIAAGINDSGTVVGYYANQGAGPSNLGFTWTASSGFSTLNLPGTNGTVPFAVNKSDQIAGYYFDDNGVAHGFLLTPTPVPPSLVLAGLGGLSLLAYGWHKHRRERRSPPQAA